MTLKHSSSKQQKAAKLISSKSQSNKAILFLWWPCWSIGQSTLWLLSATVLLAADVTDGATWHIPVSVTGKFVSVALQDARTRFSVTAMPSNQKVFTYSSSAPLKYTGVWVFPASFWKSTMSLWNWTKNGTFFHWFIELLSFVKKNIYVLLLVKRKNYQRASCQSYFEPDILAFISFL